MQASLATRARYSRGITCIDALHPRASLGPQDSVGDASKERKHKNGTHQCLCFLMMSKESPVPLAVALRLTNESPTYVV